MLVRSCFLITVIKCLKGHRSLGSLFNVKKQKVAQSLTQWQGHLLSCRVTAKNGRKGGKLISNRLLSLIFRHASVSSTYPCKLVGWLVGKLVSWLVTLSDFQSLVSNGRSNKKSSKNKVHLFSNALSVFRCIFRILIHFQNLDALSEFRCTFRI